MERSVKREPTEMELRCVRAEFDYIRADSLALFEKMEADCTAKGVPMAAGNLESLKYYRALTWEKFQADEQNWFDGVLGQVRRTIRAMWQPTPEMYAKAGILEDSFKEQLKSYDVSGFCGLTYQAMVNVASPSETEA